MEQYNIHEAKTHLSRLLARVEAGEEFIISRAGRPVARLSGAEQLAVKRQPGGWKHLPAGNDDDFDALDEDIAAMFDGGHT